MKRIIFENEETIIEVFTGMVSNGIHIKITNADDKDDFIAHKFDDAIEANLFHAELAKEINDRNE